MLSTLITSLEGYKIILYELKALQILALVSNGCYKKYLFERGFRQRIRYSVEFPLISVSAHSFAAYVFPMELQLETGGLEHTESYGKLYSC